MKTRTVATIVLVMMSTLAGGLGAGGEAPVVGTWRLLAFERHAPSGEVTTPFGPSPLGSLVYTAGGRVSVHLLQPGRPAFAAGTFRSGSDAEVRAAFEGYFGYYGRYTIEAKEGADGTVIGSVTHQVEGCAFPNYVGTDRTRTLEMRGDRLTLTTPRGDSAQPIDWYRVVWERVR